MYYIFLNFLEFRNKFVWVKVKKQNLKKILLQTVAF